MVRRLPTSVVVEGATLDEALQNALSRLRCTPDKLSYKVLQEGTGGFAGIGKKPFRVRYSIKPAFLDVNGNRTDLDEVATVDARTRIRVHTDGVFVRVSPPRNGGKPPDLIDVQTMLVQRGLMEYDHETLKNSVNSMDDAWHPIAKYDSALPGNDSTINVSVDDDKLAAWINISMPLDNGREPTKDEIREALEAHNVRAGIDEELIDEILNDQLFDVPHRIAQGKEPLPGKDGTLEFFVRTERQSKLAQQSDEKGNIDYRNLLNIENVMEGQPLAIRQAPTNGEPGLTVEGETLEASDGEAIELPLGNNVYVGEDGNTVLATITGQFIFKNGLLNVEKVHLVQGDLTLKEGDISFLGTVAITGSVEDGMTIRASENVEIGGSVGRSTVEAGGSVLLKSGIHGDGEAFIKAGQDVITKFVNSAKISAGNLVIAPEGILHSEVAAGGSVLAIGRHGKIVGGKIVAGREVVATELGSAGASTRTSIEVGTDPEAREKLRDLEEFVTAHEDTLQKLIRNISTLRKAKAAGQLHDEKRLRYLKLLPMKQVEVERELREAKEDIAEIRQYLNEISSDCRISCYNRVHPGVEIIIRNGKTTISNDVSSVTFLNKGGHVRPMAYSPQVGLPEEEINFEQLDAIGAESRRKKSKKSEAKTST